MGVWRHFKHLSAYLNELPNKRLKPPVQDLSDSSKAFFPLLDSKTGRCKLQSGHSAAGRFIFWSQNLQFQVPTFSISVPSSKFQLFPGIQVPSYRLQWSFLEKGRLRPGMPWDPACFWMRNLGDIVDAMTSSDLTRARTVQSIYLYIYIIIYICIYIYI